MLDFLRHKSVGEDVEASMSRVKTLLCETPEAVLEFRGLLNESPYCRDICPLLFLQFVEMYLQDIEDRHNMEDLIMLLPVCCRLMELHAFALDSWISLWAKSCECSGPGSNCRLSQARSLVGYVIIEVLKRTVTGSLQRNKENYVLSISGQLLSKFLLPESEGPVHIISGRWIECVVSICDIMNSLSEREVSETNIQANSEVALRMLADLALCQLLRPGDDNAIILRYIVNHSQLLSTVENKLLNRDVRITESVRSANFELENYHIAIFVLLGTLRPDVCPKLIPMVWSDSRRKCVLTWSSLALLRSPFPALGVKLSLWLLSQGMVKSDLNAVWLEELITVATSVGDERLMSVVERQEVFQAMHKTLLGSDKDWVLPTCVNVIGRSRNDSTVGIFIKIIKDVDPGIEAFRRVCKFVCSSSFGIVDATDTLKSLLNWGRLVYLKERYVEAYDGAFHHFVEDVIRQANHLQRSLEEGVQKTRIIFIGHLASRVKEIIDT